MVEILLKGAVNIALFRKLQSAGGALPYPLGQDAIAERSAIRRLEERGVVERDHEAGIYSIKRNVIVRYHKPLLARLREGPLHSSEWRSVSVSPGSLRAQVTQLRTRGVDIQSIPDRRDHDRAGGRAPVRYELRA